MSQVDEDLRAINDFFHRPANAPKTAAAKAVFNEWIAWWEDNGDNWFNGTAELDHARNLRNDYNRANAVTAEAKAQVESVIRTGMTSEQAAGETDRRNAEGGFTEPPLSVVKRWWFWPSVASGATLAVVFVVPRVVKMYLGVR